MRALNAAALALLARIQGGEQLPMPQLLEIMTATPQRYSTCGYALTWGGFTWQPVGVGIEPVEDETGSTGSQIVLALPAVTPDQLALALTTALSGVRVRIYNALIDPETMVVEHADLAWSGLADTPGIEEGPDGSFVTVICEHRAVQAARVKPSRYTNDEQRRLYTGDTSMDYDPGTDAAPVVWPAASFWRQ